MNFDDYDETIKYPVRADFTTTYCYRKGEVVATIRPGQRNPEGLAGCVFERAVDEEAFRTARAEYAKHRTLKNEAFKVDLLHDFGLPDDDFTRALIAVAFSSGNDLHTVYTNFEDLADLVPIAKRVYSKCPT